MTVIHPRTSEFSRGAGPADEPHPKVFVRAFATPAAAPWQQARAARLEARHGAPLPVSELMFKTRRIGSWTPGAPGRFAAFYVRTSEYSGPFETDVEVDGRPITITFGAVGAQLARAKGAAAICGCVAAAALLLTLGAAMALNARAETAGRLDATEQALASKRRAFSAAQRQADQTRAVKTALGRGTDLETLLGDIRWATAAKAPDARINALHWDHGLLAVEARDPSPPFVTSDRRLERSAKQIRSGVWLWGVLPKNAAPVGAGP